MPAKKISKENTSGKLFWLDSIREELDQIGPADFILPNTEIDPTNDKVAGPASFEAQKLYSLALQYEKKAGERSLEGRYEQDEKHRNFLLGLASEYQTKSDILIKIFWGVLEEQYDLWSKGSVGIRKGWTVVYREKGEEPTKSSMEDFFRRIFGDGQE